MVKMRKKEVEDTNEMESSVLIIGRVLSLSGEIKSKYMK